MTMRAVLGLSLAVAASVNMAAQAPQVEIRNSKVHIKLYVPDAKQGFYRATRFDWSGAISDLEFAGHHLYKSWFNSVDPAVGDFVYDGDNIIVSSTTAMTGPVEEFQRPIGYDTAQPGETFLKVGVGLLRKADTTPYKFGTHFELVDSGTWTTTKTSDSVTYKQVLGKPGEKFAYVYTKTIRLVGNDSKMTVEHHLRNVGTTPIQTPVYDHNFLTIDGLGVGSDYAITVPYQIQPAKPLDPRFARVEGSRASYVAELQGKDRVSFDLHGFGSSPSDYDFRIVNTHAQIEVRMQGDSPLQNVNVWSIRDVLAVEPFIQVDADAGKEFSWSYTYTYTNLAAKH